MTMTERRYANALISQSSSRVLGYVDELDEESFSGAEPASVAAERAQSSHFVVVGRQLEQAAQRLSRVRPRAPPEATHLAHGHRPGPGTGRQQVV